MGMVYVLKTLTEQNSSAVSIGQLDNSLFHLSITGACDGGGGAAFRGDLGAGFGGIGDLWACCGDFDGVLPPEEVGGGLGDFFLGFSVFPFFGFFNFLFFHFSLSLSLSLSDFSL